MADEDEADDPFDEEWIRQTLRELSQQLRERWGDRVAEELRARGLGWNEAGTEQGPDESEVDRG